MKISFDNSFKKAYKNKIKEGAITEEKFLKIVQLFIEDPFSENLKTHKLSGKLKGMWAFSVGYDLRVLFYFTNEKPKNVVFTNVGSHDEVY